VVSDIASCILHIASCYAFKLCHFSLPLRFLPHLISADWLQLTDVDCTNAWSCCLVNDDDSWSVAHLVHTVHWYVALFAVRYDTFQQHYCVSFPTLHRGELTQTEDECQCEAREGNCVLVSSVKFSLNTVPKRSILRSNNKKCLSLDPSPDSVPGGPKPSRRLRRLN